MTESVTERDRRHFLISPSAMRRDPGGALRAGFGSCARVVSLRCGCVRSRCQSTPAPRGAASSFRWGRPSPPLTAAGMGAPAVSSLVLPLHCGCGVSRASGAIRRCACGAPPGCSPLPKSPPPAPPLGGRAGWAHFPPLFSVLSGLGFGTRRMPRADVSAA